LLFYLIKIYSVT